MQSIYISIVKSFTLLLISILLQCSCNSISVNNNQYVGIWTPKNIFWERESNIEFNKTTYSSFKTLIFTSSDVFSIISSTNYLSSKDSIIVIPGEPTIKKYLCYVIKSDSDFFIFQYKNLIQDLKPPIKDNKLGKFDTIFFNDQKQTLILNGIEYLNDKKLEIDTSYLLNK